MQLENNSRVAIIGGGPAGSFTALHLQRFAAHAGLRLEIAIFELRDFSRPGPRGCNKCAGIISSKTVHNLIALGLSFPDGIILAELNSYVLHLDQNELLIEQPDPDRRIVSVYRGSGPRLGTHPPPISFDGWLIAQAQARGATLYPERVIAIRAGPRRHTIVTAQRAFEADLVILATGINSSAPLDPGWQYRPPRSMVMAQDEILLPTTLEKGHVHVFFAPPSGMIFGGLIPKGRYANISLLGHKLPPRAIAEFLKEHETTLFSQDTPTLCGCTPRIVTAPATGYYADRMVAVGDCAVTRLYKDGIGSAYVTAEAAARTAVEMGISARHFSVGYRSVCHRIARDNHYGHLLFWLWGLARRSPALVSAWQKAVLREKDLPASDQIYHRVLWGMFTGDESYRQIFWLMIGRAATHLFWDTIKAWRQK
ncbi:MAG: FAD-dependent oxidoreductase [Chloroflexota bacterium]